MEKRWTALVLALLLAVSLWGCRGAGPRQEAAPSADVTSEVRETAAPSRDAPTPAPDLKGNTESLEENGSYDSAGDVALYLRTYGKLPDNYLTKEEARDLGWTGGSVEAYAPGMCIGGDHFGNREGLLPREKGRRWTECDIDTLGAGNRGSKRLVYSNDGLIYYTDDHYETFEKIYPED